MIVVQLPLASCLFSLTGTGQTDKSETESQECILQVGLETLRIQEADMEEYAFEIKAEEFVEGYKAGHYSILIYH